MLKFKTCIPKQLCLHRIYLLIFNDLPSAKHQKPNTPFHHLALKTINHNKHPTSMDHNDLGTLGESLALKFLSSKGFEVLETNWRYQRAEVDIIARDGEILVFVEVKTRTSEYFGAPETFVTFRKEQLMVRAAHAYMQRINHQWEIRFDVISVVYRDDQNYEIRHLPDAFWPGSW